MSDDDLATVLDEAIDRINDFIVANNPTPLTKDLLNQQIRDEEAREEKLSPHCVGSEETRHMINTFKTMPRDKIRALVDELLSVPRPAVVNPCL